MAGTLRYPYYLQTDDEAGEVYLMQDGVCVALAKSRNTLAKIRDVLNAPTPLEGAWVTTFRNGRQEIGVVQAVAPRRDAGFKLLVRKADDSLSTWSLVDGDDVIRVIDKPAVEP